MMKTVLVTGADRGLGYALTEEFLKRGFLVFAGQYMPAWPALGELKEHWPQGLEILPLDSTSEESVRGAAQYIQKKTGHLDMLVNNAGVIRPKEDIFLEVSEEDLMLQFQVNAVGALRVTEFVLPLMGQGMRRLCYVSSEAGSIGNAHRTDTFGYCMSKSALNMAVRLLHNDLYEKGYTFRLYHPGWLKSYMTGDEKMRGHMEPEESAAVAAEQFLTDRPQENILVMQDVEGCLWSF